MSDGEWRIWQPAPGGRSKCDVIPIHATPDKYGSSYDPVVAIKTYGIELLYSNGSETYYPWTSIVRAEYDPPTNP